MPEKADDPVQGKIVGILRGVRGFFWDHAHLVYAMQDYAGEPLSHASISATFLREEKAELQGATDAVLDVLRAERRTAMLAESASRT